MISNLDSKDAVIELVSFSWLFMMEAIQDLLDSTIFDSVLSGNHSGKFFTIDTQTEDFIRNSGNLVGIPVALQHYLISGKTRITRDATARTFSSGCNDAFSVFGFLAFLLALLDLILELRGNSGGAAAAGGGSRKKRSLEDGDYRDGMLASYSMFRGFLNAMDAHSPTCADLFMCEAGMEASRRGRVGNLIAKSASRGAQRWLLKIDPGLHNGTGRAGLFGAIDEADSCKERFLRCQTRPPSYRYPGLDRHKRSMNMSYNDQVKIEEYLNYYINMDSIKEWMFEIIA